MIYIEKQITDKSNSINYSIKNIIVFLYKNIETNYWYNIDQESKNLLKTNL